MEEIPRLILGNTRLVESEKKGEEKEKFPHSKSYNFHFLVVIFYVFCRVC